TSHLLQVRMTGNSVDKGCKEYGSHNGLNQTDKPLTEWLQRERNSRIIPAYNNTHYNADQNPGRKVFSLQSVSYHTQYKQQVTKRQIIRWQWVEKIYSVQQYSYSECEIRKDP